MTLVCSRCHEDLYEKDEDVKEVWVEFCDIFERDVYLKNDCIVLNTKVIGWEL